MKSTANFLMIVLLSVSLFAQLDQKIMLIHQNGAVVDQRALSDIDSITFAQGAVINLSSPANGATGLSLTINFSWEAYSGATGYTLQISQNSGFTSFVYNQSGITGTSREVSGLDRECTYYWRVRAQAAYTLAWSETRSFKTVDFVCGDSFVYEGQTYNTVNYDNYQCWMKENLNVGVQINSPTAASNNSIIEKYCYNNIASNCNTYGGLYQWDEMMQYVTTPGARGICPPRWHIPSDNDFSGILGNYYSMSFIVRPCGDNGTGFSLLMGGFYNGAYYALEEYGQGHLWSSTLEYGNPFSIYVQCGQEQFFTGTRNKTNAVSVRCIRD